MMKEKKCDIIIGTHNRHEELIRCLKSFKKIKGEFNLVVIDSSLKKLEKKYYKLMSKYIYDKNKSLSYKRNLAIKISKSDFIIFTDDDCIADKNWLVELMNGFNNKNIMCVTGRTVAFKKTKESSYEKNYGFDKMGLKTRIIKKKLFFNLWRIGHGNNMAFRKEVFLYVGDYDEKLGVGSSGLAGEDTDMFFRILKKGYYIKYNPLAIIYHNHLIKEEDLPKVAYRNGHAVLEMTKKNFGFIFFISYIIWILKYSLKFFTNTKIAKQGLRGLFGFKYE